mmetsp:Transcript_27885/g.72163  ORF Transcript_27885/g.72163 Transcript_27885/m.72163 type:complete len:268 (-) Transcript_27885:296-1099(-)
MLAKLDHRSLQLHDQPQDIQQLAQHRPKLLQAHMHRRRHLIQNWVKRVVDGVAGLLLDGLLQNRVQPVLRPLQRGHHRRSQPRQAHSQLRPGVIHRRHRPEISHQHEGNGDPDENQEVGRALEVLGRIDFLELQDGLAGGGVDLFRGLLHRVRQRRHRRRVRDLNRQPLLQLPQPREGRGLVPQRVLDLPPQRLQALLHLVRHLADGDAGLALQGVHETHDLLLLLLGRREPGLDEADHVEGEGEVRGGEGGHARDPPGDGGGCGGD